MFFLMEKEPNGKFNKLDQNKNKEYLIRTLDRILKDLQFNTPCFTYKPVKLLENNKYRKIILTNDNYEYFIMEKNTVDFSEYL